MVNGNVGDVDGKLVLALRCILHGVESVEPDPSFLPWVLDLGGKPAKRPLAHASIVDLLVSDSLAATPKSLPLGALRFVFWYECFWKQ